MIRPVMKYISSGVYPQQVQPFKDGQVTHKIVKRPQEPGTAIGLYGFLGTPYQVGVSTFQIGRTVCQGCTPILITADSVQLLDMTLAHDSPEAETLAFVLGYDSFADVVAEQASSRFGLPFDGHVLTLGHVEFAQPQKN